MQNHSDTIQKIADFVLGDGIDSLSVQKFVRKAKPEDSIEYQFSTFLHQNSVLSEPQNFNIVDPVATLTTRADGLHEFLQVSRNYTNFSESPFWEVDETNLQTVDGLLKLYQGIDGYKQTVIEGVQKFTPPTWKH